MLQRVVIVDDEENIGRTLALILEREGYSFSIARSAAEFRSLAEVQQAAVILMDVRLPDGNGIDLLKELRQSGNPASVVMISGHATISDAVEATRHGAFDFLEKPLSRERVLLAVKNACQQRTLREENERLREIIGAGARMIGSSPAHRAAVEQATLAAASDARVLLTGESGTGKELLAGHIHEHSPFHNGPFVKVNCAAIPTELLESELFGHEKGAFTGATGQRRGKFELAHGGTIFLDEVGDLHSASQAKLLRVLQEGEFHRVGGEKPIRVVARVVSATNRDLRLMVDNNQFREDLYYRLCVVPIRVPALRERLTDLQDLANYFLTEFCHRNNFRPRRFHPEVFPILERYSWPGNIRELRNTVERMAILSREDELGVGAIPAEVRIVRDTAPKTRLQDARDAAERDTISEALEATDWNVSAAARRLGMERTNLHKRMRALGLQRT